MCKLNGIVCCMLIGTFDTFKIFPSKRIVVQTPACSNRSNHVFRRDASLLCCGLCEFCRIWGRQGGRVKPVCASKAGLDIVPITHLVERRGAVESPRAPNRKPSTLLFLRCRCHCKSPRVQSRTRDPRGLF